MNVIDWLSSIAGTEVKEDTANVPEEDEVPETDFSKGDPTAVPTDDDGKPII